MNKPTGRNEEFIPSLDRMRVVLDLMSTLNVVTYAGQHHVMRKALDILRGDISRALLPPNDVRSKRLSDALMAMEGEAGHVCPRATVFSDIAQIVVQVLVEIRNEFPPHGLPIKAL